MSEQNNTPVSPTTLPLMGFPELDAPAAVPVQSVQEPVAEPAVSPLNLGLEQPAAPVAEPAAPKAVEVPETKPLLDSTGLTDAERKAIDDFKGKVDITNPDHVLLYGADAQKSLGSSPTARWRPYAPRIRAKSARCWRTWWLS